MRKIIVTAALGALMALGTAAPALAHQHPESCEDVQTLVGGHHSFDCDYDIPTGR